MVEETNAETRALYQMNPQGRFSERAGDYAKYRPSYPPEAIATILEGLGDPSHMVAADIGAGTGISSRLLGDAKVRVIALEPNAEMRKAADPHPLVEFREGTAEQTNLPDASVDLVTCFQAFHWFDPVPTLWEFRRILKPSGRLALVWNTRDRSDPFTAEYSRLVRIASNNHPAFERMESANPLLTSPHFVNIRQHSFAHRQELDLSGLIGRTQSSSYVPREGLAQEQLVADLQKLYEQWTGDRGLICLVYQTKVYLADPSSTDK